MRIIDADELLNKIKDGHYPVLLNEKIEFGYALLMVCSDISDAPTVDAEPIRHGEWIDMGDFETCSVCKGTHLKMVETVYGKVIWIKSKYCHNCGAKMDGGEYNGT